MISLGAPLVGAQAQLSAMIGALRHRGPDGMGYYSDSAVGLAHARLSIVDLEGGAQPIANEDGAIQVVFNGEIFNYIELRSELRACGHTFKTASDTEVIVHAYEQYGDEFVDRLNGQFAIALWDSRKQRLLLVRDRLGIRPLFFIEHAQRLWFASEMKSLQQVIPERLQIDPLGVAQTFSLWSTVGEQSIYNGVKSLRPGHMLSVERGKLVRRCYWQWHYPPERDVEAPPYSRVCEELRQRLVDAVRLQLRADVPVGAYLSGGLDSSAIAALICRYTGAPLRTFSLTFEDPEFDESVYQQQVVRHLGTDHTSVSCTRADIGREFPRFVAHAETPVLRTAPVPLMLLSGLVREAGYKVVLTGEGADEVFCGYDIFKEAKIRRFWAEEPESEARPALLTRLYPYLRRSPVGSAAMAKSFYGAGLLEVDSPCYAHRPRWTTTARLWNFLNKDLRADLSTVDPCSWVQPLMPVGHEAWSGTGRDQYVEFTTLLSGYLLSSQGDRVAMANSVEGRYPFLDHTLIEFANQLPRRYLMRALREKAVLRDAVADLLPPSIGERTKQPYRAPDSASFFVDGKPLDYVAELFTAQRIARSGLFDVDSTLRLFVKCQSGRAFGFADNMAFVGILSTLLLDT